MDFLKISVPGFISTMGCVYLRTPYGGLDHAPPHPITQNTNSQINIIQDDLP